MGLQPNKSLNIDNLLISETNKFCLVFFFLVQIFLESVSYLKEINIPFENIWLYFLLLQSLHLLKKIPIHSMTQLSMKSFNCIMHSEQKFCIVIWEKDFILSLSELHIMLQQFPFLPIC